MTASKNNKNTVNIFFKVKSYDSVTFKYVSLISYFQPTISLCSPNWVSHWEKDWLYWYQMKWYFIDKGFHPSGIENYLVSRCSSSRSRERLYGGPISLSLATNRESWILSVVKSTTETRLTDRGTVVFAGYSYRDMFLGRNTVRYLITPL